MSEYINSHSDRIRITPAESGGSAENMRRVSRGDMGFGHVLTPNIMKGWQGVKPFEEALHDALVIGPSLNNVIHTFFVREDSDVLKVADLAGESFGGGAPGSAASLWTEMAVEYLGLKDVDLQFFPYSEMMDLVSDRTLVGHARAMTYPASYLDQANSAWGGLRILDLGELVDTTDILKDNPFFIKVEVPAGTQEWQTEAFTSFATTDFFIANRSVPDEDVYEFCKLAYTDGCIAGLPKGVHGFWPVNKNPLNGLPIVLHPGALKFWKETGVPIPEPILK